MSLFNIRTLNLDEIWLDIFKLSMVRRNYNQVWNSRYWKRKIRSCNIWFSNFVRKWLWCSLCLFFRDTMPLLNGIPYLLLKWDHLRQRICSLFWYLGLQTITIWRYSWSHSDGITTSSYSLSFPCSLKPIVSWPAKWNNNT